MRVHFCFLSSTIIVAVAFRKCILGRYIKFWDTSFGFTLDPIVRTRSTWNCYFPNASRIGWTRLYLLGSPQKRRNLTPSTLTRDYATASKNAMTNSRVSSAFGGAQICRLSIFGVCMHRVKCPGLNYWQRRGSCEDFRPCQCPACAHPARLAV